mgnify:CR=1 FL=1
MKEGVSYQTINDKESTKALLLKLKDSKEFSVEVAVSDDHTISAIAFSCKPGEAFAVTVENEQTLNDFTSLLADETKFKIGHNIKATILALKDYGVVVSSPLFDTMIAHYLVEPESAHDLQTLSELYFNYRTMGDKDGEVYDRLCEHADLALQLKGKLQPELEKRGHSSLMRDVEMPLVQVLEFGRAHV